MDVRSHRAVLTVSEPWYKPKLRVMLFLLLGLAVSTSVAGCGGDDAKGSAGGKKGAGGDFCAAQSSTVLGVAERIWDGDYDNGIPTVDNTPDDGVDDSQSAATDLTLASAAVPKMVAAAPPELADVMKLIADMIKHTVANPGEAFPYDSSARSIVVNTPSRDVSAWTAIHCV